MTSDDRATIDHLLSDDSHPPSPLSPTEKDAVRRLVEERDELLAACKKMLAWAIEEGPPWHEPIPDEDMQDDFKRDVDAARAAIAKVGDA